jgi:cysteinyl-tRNA synthetase
MENSPVPATGCEDWAERIAASLHAEREGVREFLAAQQTRLERAEATLEDAIAQLQGAISDGTADRSDAAGGSNDQEDYRQRYEMALDDLREMKASNSRLQEQLSKAKTTATAFAKETRSQQPSLDWESEKLRILAALESDLDENDSEQRAERLKIEDVLRATENAIAKKDEEIAEKDSEIRELKQRLVEASETGPLDQMAATIEQTLQNDIIIQQERERLRQLEEQVQSRMCRAEIEISLERAKLARERAEIEERLRLAGLDAAKPAGEPNAAEQPTRGRWLSRLGLTEADRERGKRR